MTIPNTAPPSEKSFAELNNLQPLVETGVLIEPALLVDISGSNSESTSAEDSTQRWNQATQIARGVVTELADDDSAGEHEEGGGGVMTTVFAEPEGQNSATVIGDLNPANFDEEWKKIRIGGRTFAAPGLKLVVDNYMEEFGSKSPLNRPLLGLIIQTDGELHDTEEFLRQLGELISVAKVVIAVYGWGDNHASALTAYRAIEKQHPKMVRVLEVTPNVTPVTVAQAMVSLLGLGQPQAKS